MRPYIVGAVFLHFGCGIPTLWVRYSYIVGTHVMRPQAVVVT